ncbi:hypothetical protein SAMN05216327_112175 [Dyadobacter sp. SG02]|uniref:hypothetical protein n=1 Tax=Dyadobacter sp. SG02 TaxID=1855291 RepID=UPI0008D2D28A|nr:hypothetical protein [Dyadobacter sp. SG02]SEJ54803.1 hypothetical protein SAMN05216327_112175 [Dyadobacter sp. SG02]
MMTFSFKLANRKNLLLLTGVVMMFVGASCAPKYEPTPAPDRLLPELTTGIATFKGNAVENFYLNYVSLGNVPIEEYGIVYAFLPDTTAVDLVIGGSYPTAKFKNAPKTGANTETFNIALPSGMHALSYRAYAKVVGGEVRYASNRMNKTY